jgi:hypothetical protein
MGPAETEGQTGPADLTEIFTFVQSIPLRTVKHKIGEKYSQAQQYILQLYNCHRMLVFLRHVSTHFPSHPQALHNLRLISHRLTVSVLLKLIKYI